MWVLKSEFTSEPTPRTRCVASAMNRGLALHPPPTSIQCLEFQLPGHGSQTLPDLWRVSIRAFIQGRTVSRSGEARHGYKDRRGTISDERVNRLADG